MYETLQDIIDANESAGQCWFQPETMRWWGCEVDDVIYPVGDGAYFVSEDEDPHGIRRRTVRFCDAYGHIQTVGDFHCWPTKMDAHREAQKHAKSH